MFNPNALKLPEDLVSALWPNTTAEVHPTNFGVTLWACIARSGVQAYLPHEVGLESDDDATLVGVYRSGDFIKKLTSKVVGSLLILSHKDLNVEDVSAPKIVGFVREARRVYYQGESFCMAKILFHDYSVVDEISSQLGEFGELHLPLSPGYTPSQKLVDGTWVDSAGLLGNKGAIVPYSIEQVSKNLTLNHIAIVDFGRGGSVAQAYCNNVAVSDSLYEYPQVRLNKDQTTKPEETKIMEEKLDQIADSLQKLSDMFTKNPNEDKMSEMNTKMDKVASTCDQMCATLSGLAAAIQKSYEGEDTLGDQAKKTVEKVQTAGESGNFLHDESAKAEVSTEVKALADSQKTLTDAVAALLQHVTPKSTTDDSLPSYRHTLDQSPRGYVESDDGSLIVI